MLRIKEVDLQPKSAVIPREEFAAVLDAEAIIAEAREKAAQIVRDAEATYEQRKQEGYEDGLTEGRLEMSEKMIDTVASSIDFLSALESKVVQLVTKSVKKVLGEIPQPDRITSVVKNAIAVARNEPKVTVRVCPSDVETVQSRVDEIMKPYPSINFIDVVPDTRLQEDGCVLETDIGIVDAGVETQLKAIHQSLERSVTGA